MSNKQLISNILYNFYTNNNQEKRLTYGLGKFEFERTKQLIEQHLFLPKSTIIDIGGGSGVYAEWLALKGHEIYLFDPIEKHIKRAKRKSQKLSNKLHVQQGEAQKIPLPNNFADVVILHGPLYHLQEKNNRLKAISEAKRILKKEGLLLAVTINFSANTLAGLLNGNIHDKGFLKICKDQLDKGFNNPTKDFPWILAEAYYHRSTEFRYELEQKNLNYINTFAIEGISWLDKNFFNNILIPEKKNNLLQLLKITQNDPDLFSFSPHLFHVARK